MFPPEEVPGAVMGCSTNNLYPRFVREGAWILRMSANSGLLVSKIPSKRQIYKEGTMTREPTAKFEMLDLLEDLRLKYSPKTTTDRVD